MVVSDQQLFIMEVIGGLMTKEGPSQQMAAEVEIGFC